MKGEVFFEKDFLYTSNVYEKSPYAQKNTAFLLEMQMQLWK